MIQLKSRISTAQAQNEKPGKQVVLAGWVQDIKVLGKLAFAKLRDREGEIQVVFFPDKFKKFNDLKKITRESVVSIKGKVQKSKLKAGGNEILATDLDEISLAQTPLPIEFLGKGIETDLSKRLDYRYLDIRNRKIRAIFEVQSEICRAYREFFTERGFTEVWLPSIISSAAEGGTELFPAKYFGKDVYLAQSPQLYKQMLAITDLEKIFSIAPIWRAEPHDTHKHLNESRQMDIEVAFATQEDVIKYLDECVKHIVKSVKTNCTKQIELLNPDLKVPTTKSLSYEEAIRELTKSGFKIKHGEDISSEAEHKLAELFGKQTLIHVHSWPTKIKPFYIMPKDPKVSCGFDTEYGGVELASGGQRVHIPNLLTKQIIAKGLSPKSFKFYIDAFKYGACPHSGWSIGLERLTMIITGQANIREAVLFPRDSTRVTP